MELIEVTWKRGAKNAHSTALPPLAEQPTEVRELKGGAAWRLCRWRERYLHRYYCSADGRVAYLVAWEVQPGGDSSSAQGWLRTVKPLSDSAGYYYLSTKVNGRSKNYRIHRVVAETWLGHVPPGKEVDHINGCRTDNRAANLQYISHRENVRKANRWAIRHDAHGGFRRSRLRIELPDTELHMDCRGYAEAAAQLGIGAATLRMYMSVSGHRCRVRGCMVTNLSALAELRAEQVAAATTEAEAAKGTAKGAAGEEPAR